MIMQWFAVLAVVALVHDSLLGAVANPIVHSRNSWHIDKHWIDTWATMPQLTEPANLPPAPFNQTGLVFKDTTIRQTVHVSVGAPQIRISISNAFGISDLPITSVTVALPYNGASGVSAIQPKTVKIVTFSGSPNYTIPNGALAVSDAIDFAVKAQSILAITIYLADGQTTNYITSHPGSRTTSWMAFGNQVNAANLTGSSLTSVAHWYFISAVEAYVPTSSSAFVIVGDSITDGRGSDTDKNNRWPDLLLARMQKDPRTSSIAVINEAAGGNRILNDGLGPNALGRIDRDVLAQSGVQYAMIFEGVNDIGTAPVDTLSQKAVGDRLIAAYQQIATRIHTFGIPIFSATITPFSTPGYNNTIQPYSDPTREKTRQRVNEWIRRSGVFDEVIDFDRWLADPKNPSQLDPKYNGGDYLHPNGTGYQTIADLFPLGIF